MYERVLPSMRKWRRSTQPAVPGTLPEYSRALAAHPVFGPMHLALVSAGGASAVIIGMPGFAECLRESAVLVADGTFLTVPAGLQAYQLLTLHTVAMGQHYHPVVALMENRRQHLYRAVLQKVWELAGNPEPETVLSDYEPALQGALREVTDAPLQGCYFHFLQALVKRGRQEHVPMRLVRLYATLALLPAERAPAAFAAQTDAAMFLQIPLNHAYHLYFRDYWMNIIRPETFSVYQKSHRTSNTAESFHAYLKKMLGASPNIWRFTHLTSIYFQIFSFSTGSRRARGIAAKVCRVRIAAAGQSRRSLFTAEARPPWRSGEAERRGWQPRGSR
ncbi:uncharacterized protein isoform X3 [Choristoneura fumiferana]|uniref:uncharacterized protein isoform X3 n=1 Tax=Choristoneura fumiferana TaxID=7141 RepID=UPI003D15D029